MFEDIIWFFVILLSSKIVSTLLFSGDRGPFTRIIMGFAYIGVLVHELCHFVMSLVAGIVPRGIKVKYRSEVTGAPNPHGSVSIGPKRNFLQAFLICLAPLFISTWLIFWSLTITFNDIQGPIVRILAGFFCFSLFIGAAPSNTDFRILFQAFQADTAHSMYQISLAFISILLNWIVMYFFQITLLLDVYYYVAIIITYYALKYGIIGIKKIISDLRYKYAQGVMRLNLKYNARENYKSVKPSEIGIEEAQW